MPASPLNELFTRGVGEFIGRAEFEKKLASGQSPVVKYGVDPTRPDIHLGHAVCLRKLRALQDLGCRIVFLVGDFTATIGDPTGRSKVRPELDQKEIEANMQTYLAQVGKILRTDAEHFVWIRNSDWYVSMHDILPPARGEIGLQRGEDFLKLRVPEDLPPQHLLFKATMWGQTRMQQGEVRHYSFLNILSYLRKITHAQLIDRDLFQERIKNHEELFLHEMLYPILQGIDSNALAEIFGSCDLEIGGTDQHFNMLMGRKILELSGRTPQSVLTLEILTGTDGQEKMSKSLDNYIGIAEAPREIFGKTMRIPDGQILKWLELSTDLPLKDFQAKLSAGENPRNLKAALAQELVRLYHGDEAAQNAPQEFDRMFKDKGRPDEVMQYAVRAGEWKIVELIIELKLVSSKSEARRLIEQGGVKINEAKISDVNLVVKVGIETMSLQVGKRKFAEVKAG
jgi:tyrosyl-tRNA synthetase